MLSGHFKDTTSLTLYKKEFSIVNNFFPHEYLQIYCSVQKKFEKKRKKEVYSNGNSRMH